ncbi:MAG: hypothetical protein JSS14_22950 [Proteobacteria bacterium]|nr:hypothetical protein [Pseudomonadota bacterium]
MRPQVVLSSLSLILAVGAFVAETSSLSGFSPSRWLVDRFGYSIPRQPPSERVEIPTRPTKPPAKGPTTAAAGPEKRQDDCTTLRIRRVEVSPEIETFPSDARPKIDADDETQPRRPTPRRPSTRPETSKSEVTVPAGDAVTVAVTLRVGSVDAERVVARKGKGCARHNQSVLWSDLTSVEQEDTLRSTVLARLSAAGAEVSPKDPVPLSANSITYFTVRSTTDGVVSASLDLQAAPRTKAPDFVRVRNHNGYVQIKVEPAPLSDKDKVSLGMTTGVSLFAALLAFVASLLAIRDKKKEGATKKSEDGVAVAAAAAAAAVLTALNTAPPAKMQPATLAQRWRNGMRQRRT